MSDRWQVDGRLVEPSFGRRFIPVIVAGVVLIGAGGTILWAMGSNSAPVVSPSAAAAVPVSTDLAERTRDLEVTEQQAVDQLQVVQDQLAAQQAETKKMASQLEALNEKLDELQQSVSSVPASAVGTAIATTKATRKGRN